MKSIFDRKKLDSKNLFCKKHTFFSKGFIDRNVIDRKIINTGIGSLNLACGKKTIFYYPEDKKKSKTVITPEMRDTGIGGVQLWCGRHIIFN